jgi:hypothetical protein
VRIPEEIVRERDVVKNISKPKKKGVTCPENERNCPRRQIGSGLKKEKRFLSRPWGHKKDGLPTRYLIDRQRLLKE